MYVKGRWEKLYPTEMENSSVTAILNNSVHIILGRSLFGTFILGLVST